MALQPNKEILLDLIRRYGNLRESQGCWHTLGKCGFDPEGNEQQKIQEAEDLYDKIATYIHTGTIDALV